MDSSSQSFAGFDDDAVHVLRLAAKIGAAIHDDVFVSFTTLLLGLLYGKNAKSHAFLTLLRDLSPQTESELLHVKPTAPQESWLAPTDIMRFASEIASEPTPSWPSGRPLLSTSAETMLNIARDNSASPTRVGVSDLVTAYLLKAPGSHREDMQNWGFSDSVVASILAKLNPEASGAGQIESAPTASAQDPGYDEAGSAVLRLAEVLARRRLSPRTALINTRVLLVSLAESSPLVSKKADVALVGCLLEALRAGDPDAPYASYRPEPIELPPITPALVGQPASVPSPRSDNVTAQLTTAAAIAAMTSAPVVGLRHILAAILIGPDGTDRARNLPMFRHLGVETGKLLESLKGLIATEYASDNQREWRNLLIGDGSSRIATMRPDAVPEDPRTDDRLGLRRFADAMGALIAAERQEPPLSIAVFGPWGSGKSFFMKMIRAAVKDFAASGAKTSDGKPMFKQRVVPIWFNAWHYVEGNLWASLVHAILAGLEKELSPENQRSTFEDMLQKLNLHQAARLEAQEGLRAAEARLDETKAALQQAEAAASIKRTEQENIPNGETVIRKVWDMTLEELRPRGDDVTSQAWIKSVCDSASKAAECLGRPDLLKSVQAVSAAASGTADTAAALNQKVGDMEDLLDEVRATAARGASTLGWLANVRFSRDEWIRLIGLVALMFIGLMSLTVLLEKWAGNIAATVAAVTTTLAPLIAAAGVTINWAKGHLGEATRAFAVLESLRKRVEQTQNRRLVETDAALLAARQATAAAETECARRKAFAEAARAALDKAEHDLADATSAKTLMRFVAQRLADGDYQRHLGLVHTIREDMEKLQKTLENVHQHEAKIPGAETAVQRIVLYIDDLDRCPPQRVVEVLEAVHLLLAFSLFVVVVGVDIRWVSQALRKRYPQQLGDGKRIASPTDYLEKVFQVPFWLPPMDKDAGRRLLTLAIGDVTVRHPPPKPAAPGAASPTPQPASSASSGPAAPISAAGEHAIHPAPDGRTDAPELDLAGMAEALTLEAKERDRLLDMAQAVGISPRRAQRFANLYRLLKASLSPAERRNFVTSEEAAIEARSSCSPRQPERRVRRARYSRICGARSARTRNPTLHRSSLLIPTSCSRRRRKRSLP